MQKVRPVVMKMSVACLLFALAGCAGTTVYDDPTTVNKMGGPTMTDSDVKLIVDDIVQDLLQAPFMNRYTKRPITISVLHIANKTSEFIDTDALIGDKMMMSIIKSGVGVFEFVDRKLLDETILESKLAADGLVSADEATKLGKAAGVTLLMTGELTSMRQNDRSKDQRYYRMSLRLVDTERNTIVWADDKDIRKTANKGW